MQIFCMKLSVGWVKRNFLLHLHILLFILSMELTLFLLRQVLFLKNTRGASRSLNRDILKTMKKESLECIHLPLLLIIVLENFP